jgi:hypothetical protein
MFDDTEIIHVVSETVNLWQYLEFQTFLHKENILALKVAKTMH